MSLALTAAGVRFLPFKNCWKFEYKGGHSWLPSLAADFPGIHWPGGTSWGRAVLDSLPPYTIQVPQHDTRSISKKRGILFFGPGTDASGHLTLWNGQGTHFGPSDAFFGMPRIIFWQIGPDLA
jgi:hypothetical protein